MTNLPHHFAAAPLYAILDTRSLQGFPAEEIGAAWLRAGVRVIQYRHKDAWQRRHLAECERICRQVIDGGGIFVVNDRADIALCCAASGAHLGQEDIPAEAARGVLPAGAIIGLSTHSVGQARAAVAGRIDYLAVGPVFVTTTKENPDPTVGLELVREARAMTSLPLVAIGGITKSNCRDVLAAGADAVAVISGLVAGCASIGQVEQRAREFLAVLRD